MAKYLCKRKTLIAHMAIVVEEGQTFEAEFPEGMTLGDNLELVEPEPEAKAKKPKAAASDESLT